MSNPRAPIDYASQVVADLAILIKIGREVLAEDHGVAVGELERGSDIISHLARSAASLSGDVSMLTSLQQHATAKETVREALAALHAIDPFVFAPSPSPRRLAMLMLLALPNCTDWASATTNAELDSSDIRRRTWATLCRRMVAENREHQIPSDDDAALMAATPPPGHGGIAASRSTVPMQWIKPERT